MADIVITSKQLEIFLSTYVACCKESIYYTDFKIGYSDQMKNTRNQKESSHMKLVEVENAKTQPK